MGVRKLLFLNGHGGNSLPVGMAQQSLKKSFPYVRCWASNYWQFAAAKIQALRSSPLGGMGHACELETSLTMFLYPDAVRVDKIKDAGRNPGNVWLQNEMFLAAKVSQVQNFDEFTDTGVFGSPSQATPEKGRLFFEAILEGAADFVRSVSQAGIEDKKEN